MIPIYRARHDCPYMAIVFVQIAKKAKRAAMHKVPYQLQQPSTLTTSRSKNQFIRKLFCSKKRIPLK